MASVGILVFLLLVLREVLSAAWERLRTGGEPDIDALTFVVMGGDVRWSTSAVVIYERRAGRRLQSEVLLADAHHTLSDLLTSATVIAALIGVQLGYPWLDPVAALVVAGFIGYACWEIFKATTGILADRIVIRRGRRSARWCRSVPRSARLPPHPHARLGRLRVSRPAHLDGRRRCASTRRIALSHVVKDRLMARFPQIKDAVIHIEPPPQRVQCS